VPTAIFIHGNRVDADDAIEEAWCLYQRMKQQACGRPFRFVVWSWPADRIVRRNRPDVQIKACYSDAQGYYLARSLREMPPGAPVTLIGHSFGARAILGALHLMAGGQVAGRALPGAAAGPAQHEPPRIRAVLAAAAVDADALLPCHAYGLALSQAERILVTENGRERALKWYPRMYGRRGPEAMGYVGPLCCPRAGCDKLEVVNVACSVGRAHSWYRYQAAPEVVQRLGWYTLFEGSAE
jgi:esterase/lipase superfamily enzyme